MLVKVTAQNGREGGACLQGERETPTLKLQSPRFKSQLQHLIAMGRLLSYSRSLFLIYKMGVITLGLLREQR